MAEYNDTFTPPAELQLHMSSSSCSMDMSVLSAGSSFSSVNSSASRAQERLNKRNVHRKRHSAAKFHNYSRMSGRWNESHGSGMNMSLCSRSQNRLSQSKLSPRFRRMVTHDVPVHAPFRKGSKASLTSKENHDSPAHVPVRKESITCFDGGIITSKAKLKNFEWKSSSTVRRVSHDNDTLVFPAMVETSLGFNPTSPVVASSQPPAIPRRQGSKPHLAAGTGAGSFFRQPPFVVPPTPCPVRKESLMDFDQLPAQVGGGDVMPPPAFQRNHTWSADPKSRHKDFMGNSSGRGKELFLAVPTITRFELSGGHSSAVALPPVPRRRGSDVNEDQGMTAPMQRMSLMSAPPVPKRKESYMDINDLQ